MYTVSIFVNVSMVVYAECICVTVCLTALSKVWILSLPTRDRQFKFLRCHISLHFSRFLRFVGAREKTGAPDASAEAEVHLSDEQIKSCGQQFGIEMETKGDYVAMQKTMLRDTFRDWVNACGHLQIMQNALAKGIYKERKDGLWKQAIVRR